MRCILPWPTTFIVKERRNITKDTRKTLVEGVPIRDPVCSRNVGRRKSKPRSNHVIGVISLIYAGRRIGICRRRGFYDLNQESLDSRVYDRLEFRIMINQRARCAADDRATGIRTSNGIDSSSHVLAFSVKAGKYCILYEVICFLVKGIIDRLEVILRILVEGKPVR